MLNTGVISMRIHIKHGWLSIKEIELEGTGEEVKDFFMLIMNDEITKEERKKVMMEDGSYIYN
jgi:hypothetical protein